MSKQTIKFVDLFAGIGGFAAALVGMGFECYLAVEKDKAASDVYLKNWGHKAFGNIVDPTREKFGNTMEIGPHDILTGGFPCQPFSKSGHQEGVLDASRGTLFGNIVAVLRNLDYDSRPTIIILENVRNLAGPKHKNDLESMKVSLRMLGYTVEVSDVFLSPHELKRECGGSPQNRERIFLVGTKHPKGTEEGSLEIVENYLTSESFVGLSEFLAGKKVDGDVNSYWDVKRDLLNVGTTDTSGSMLSAQEVHVLEVWDEWQKALRQKGKKLPGFPVWTQYWKESVTYPENCQDWKKDFIDKNQRLYMENKVACNTVLKQIKQHAFTATQSKFEWQAGDTKSVFDGLVHFRPSGVRVKRATYFPALVAITHTPVLAWLRRRISVKEAARLQKFPKNFQFDSDSRNSSYKQLGNAVSVGVIWQVLKCLAARDEALLLMSAAGKAILKATRNAPEDPDLAFEGWEPKANTTVLQ